MIIILARSRSNNRIRWVGKEQTRVMKSLTNTPIIMKSLHSLPFERGASGAHALAHRCYQRINRVLLTKPTSSLLVLFSNVKLQTMRVLHVHAEVNMALHTQLHGHFFNQSASQQASIPAAKTSNTCSLFRFLSQKGVSASALFDLYFDNRSNFPVHASA